MPNVWWIHIATQTRTSNVSLSVGDTKNCVCEHWAAAAAETTHKSNDKRNPALAFTTLHNTHTYWRSERPGIPRRCVVFLLLLVHESSNSVAHYLAVVFFSPFPVALIYAVFDVNTLSSNAGATFDLLLFCWVIFFCFKIMSQCSSLIRRQW